LLFVHCNYIHFVPLKSRTAASYVSAYLSLCLKVLLVSVPSLNLHSNR
jgi:hypothetical protein